MYCLLSAREYEGGRGAATQCKQYNPAVSWVEEEYGLPSIILIVNMSKIHFFSYLTMALDTPLSWAPCETNSLCIFD